MIFPGGLLAFTVYRVLHGVYKCPTMSLKVRFRNSPTLCPTFLKVLQKCDFLLWHNHSPNFAHLAHTVLDFLKIFASGGLLNSVNCPTLSYNSFSQSPAKGQKMSLNVLQSGFSNANV